MGFVFFWLLFAVLVGFFANNKGRSGFGFFLLSLLLSPLIGFIIALLVKPELKVVEQKAIEQGDSKKCPECAEIVKAEAKICRHCRYQFK